MSRENTEQSNSPLITYAGRRRDGLGVIGAKRGNPAELCRQLYDDGLVEATLIVDGEEVGGISWEGPRRLWWAEEGCSS